MRYRSYNEYLKQKYGCKVYKLSLSISNTCPNRDGKCGTGGCIFCSGGSGDFASEYKKSLKEQISDAKKKVESKNKSGKYIAYFQSYTSTYIKPDKLENALLEVLEHKEIVGIAIGTRPDCLDDDIMNILSKTAKIKPLTIELGLQTSNKKTALLINRCCPLSKYKEAAQKLKQIGAEVVFHVILGLPHENENDILNTISFVNECNADGIKLQLLHVLKNTKLFEMYQNGEFETLSQQKYFKILSKSLEHLNPEIVVHRLTGDGNKKELASPEWSADKKRVMNDMNKYFEKHNIIQGSKYKSASH